VLTPIFARWIPAVDPAPYSDVFNYESTQLLVKSNRDETVYIGPYNPDIYEASSDEGSPPAAPSDPRHSADSLFVDDIEDSGQSSRHQPPVENTTSGSDASSDDASIIYLGTNVIDLTSDFDMDQNSGSDADFGDDGSFDGASIVDPGTNIINLASDTDVDANSDSDSNSDSDAVLLLDG
jgi:hypothetical protein